MNLIVSKELQDVRYMLGSSETAAGRYNQIKATFPQGDEYKIFAEPIILNDGFKISWVSTYEGNAINYNKLSDEEKSDTRDLLTKKIKILLDATKKFEDSTLTDFLMKCIEIPDMNDIYLIKNQGDKNVVLTQWGFISDMPGAEKGLLEKIINTKKIPMVFNVVFNDNGQTAPFEEVVFEYNNAKTIVKSDAKGIITLEKIKENSIVKAFEQDGEQLINMQKFTCYEDGHYTVKVTPMYDMNFVVTDQNNNPLSGLEFCFDYNNQTINAVSDAEGKMQLQKVKNGLDVKAYQLINLKQDNVNNFICAGNTPVYNIILNIETVVAAPPPLPKTYNMRFKVVDEKGDIVRNAEVTAHYNSKTIKLKTDNEGYCILPDITPGTEVKVEAKK